MKKGLVSISFRKLSPEEIVELCVKTGLKYIEWGADVHLRPENIERIKAVKSLCEDRGLIPIGYGSYYNAADDFDKFLPNLEAACILGTEYIRIWGGKTAAHDKAAEDNIGRAVSLAKERELTVCLECHRWTMTEDHVLAVKVAEATGCRLHFQPNPDITFEQNLDALKAMKPHLCACHVFAWEKGNVRLPLRDHRGQWLEYIAEAGDVPYLMEFVQDDDPINLVRDAGELAFLTGAIKARKAAET